MATTTATNASAADHRPRGRPVGTYTTQAGAERRVWRQHGRDGIRLVESRSTAVDAATSSTEDSPQARPTP